ncbi:hypothetical protein LCGC14_3062410, partial [marine sediment metagenome]
MNKVLVRSLAAVLCVAGVCAAADDVGDAFRADLSALTAGAHRLSGLGDGSLPASRYVEGRLRGMGVKEVYIQNFLVPQLLTTECTLTVDGKAYSEGVYPMRPNSLQGVVTPAEGLTARTVYAGKGELRDYTSSARDAIVVLRHSYRFPATGGVGGVS